MKLLVAIDIPESSAVVIGAAKSLANKTDDTIILLHVAAPDPDFVGYDVDPPVMRDAVAARFHEEHRLLQTLGKALRDDGLECAALLVQGPTVETILREAGKVSADLIVLGSHGKGILKRMALGSVSEGVLRQAIVPVLVVPVSAKVTD